MNGPKYVVMGHTTLDNVVYTDGRAYFSVAGGAGLYAASGAAYWCANKEVGVVTKLGRQFRAEDYLSICSHPAIDGTGIKRMDREGIKLWMLFDDDGYRHWVLQHDSCSRQSAAPSADDIPDSFIETALGYHFSPLPPDSVEELLERIPKGRYIQLDPHYEWFFPQFAEQWKRILPRIDVALPSEDELCKFFDIPYGQPESVLADYAARLCQMGVKTVIVKMGQRGAMAYDGAKNRCILIPSCAEKVKDATGAGDTFGGSFLVSQTNGGNVELSMAKGSIGASLTLEHEGVMENFALSEDAVQVRCKKNLDKLLNSVIEIH